MDEALVEHAEDDVHDEYGGHQQQELVGQVAAESERRSLESRSNAVRQPDAAFGVFDGRNGGAERSALAQVEGYGGRRKLRQVIDEKRPRFHIHFGDRRQRYLTAGRRRHVDGRERVHGSVVGRIRFHDDAILIRLSEDRGHDALAEGVVQRVVDRTHADAEARRAVAVDGDVGRKSVIFLVADDVGELGLLTKRRQQLGSPRGQYRGVRAFQGELVLGAAHGVVEGKILHRLHVQRDARDVGRLGPQPPDGIGDVRAALAARFQIDQETPAVQSDIVAVDTDEGRQAEHIRILENRGRERLLPIGHGGVGNRLARFGDALNQSGVLCGKEALRNQNIENRGQRQGGRRDVHGQSLVIQHPGELPAIPLDQGAEPPSRLKLRVFARRPMFEELGAHHGHEGQGHHGGDENRDGQRYREFAEQAPDHILHEEQRNEHRDQRHGQRYDGEADLSGALERSLERRLADFDVARYVFDHHDGVVDDETRRDGQRHQR